MLLTVGSFDLVPPTDDTRRAVEDAVAAGRLPRSLADAALGGGSVRVIVELPFVATANTAAATTENNEPTQPTCNGTATPLGKTVWYRLAVQNRATPRISTEGSNFDTVVFAWRNPSIANPGGFTTGQCNDDIVARVNRVSRLEFTAQAGEVFMIQVGGFSEVNGVASGSLRLAIDGSATVSVTKSGSGTVTSTPGGITRGADCSEAYGLGSPVALTAAPPAGGASRTGAAPAAGPRRSATSPSTATCRRRRPSSTARRGPACG